MLMKRKILIVALLVIFAAMTALGTLAYFNTETVAHNVVTTGKVDIALMNGRMRTAAMSLSPSRASCPARPSPSTSRSSITTARMHGCAPG